jgi:hypothetical protein
VRAARVGCCVKCGKLTFSALDGTEVADRQATCAQARGDVVAMVDIEATRGASYCRCGQQARQGPPPAGGERA